MNQSQMETVNRRGLLTLLYLVDFSRILFYARKLEESISSYRDVWCTFSNSTNSVALY